MADEATQKPDRMEEECAVFGVYAVMVLGTATMNAVLAAILTPVLRAVLKR